MYEYPYQIQSAFAKSSDALMTFGVDAKFALEAGNVMDDAKAEVNPLEMHAGYSRFCVTIIRKEKDGKKVVTANIPAVDDADEIISNTMAAGSLLMAQALNPVHAETQEGAKAAGVQIRMGKYKGRTPAEVLSQDPSQRQGLLDQAKFLGEKASVYPANREQIDAINEAVALYDAGKLGGIKTSSASVTIYEADYKPLESTLDGGRVMVYSVKILCCPKDRYPFKVTVKNMWSAWDPKTRTTHPAAGDRSEELTMSFSARKWFGIARKMERELAAFETCMWSSQWKKAESANTYNRRRAGEKKPAV